MVGFSDLPGDATNHAFLWQDGVMTDLGTGHPLLLGWIFGAPPSALTKRAWWLAARAMKFNNCRAGIWQTGEDDNRMMTDLNTLIPAGSPLYLFFAFDVNDRGEIVGGGIEKSTGQFHAFLATPTNWE